MCTLVVLRRPGADWPLLVAANRDEMSNRPWQGPGAHWRDRPQVVAGLDRLSGGSWLGVNRHGLMAGVLNRYGTLGPAPGKRSRGELVLEALDHAEAREAAAALGDLNPLAYRGFNLVVADASDAFWLTLREDAGAVEVEALPPGLSMLTARELNDPESPRIRFYKPRFEAAGAPDPELDDWAEWQSLLAAREFEDGAGPGGAMCVELEGGFGTVSSSLLALPEDPEAKPRWLFCPGRPDREAFHPVTLFA
jgi:uncharacterized protein with NRDE domain